MTPSIALDIPAARAADSAHSPVVRSTDDLGEAIAELATRLHAATYQLLVMLREFDAKNGWNNGFLSCAHWLHWRTSIDLGACREKVRVARASAALPLASATMETGQLSYAKVRAITRVATPENERRLVDVALAGTAAQVERVVRAWRRVDRAEEAATTNARHLHRNLSTWLDDDGMLVIRGRLSPEVGAVVQRALEAAADALFREHAGAAKAQSMTEEVTPAQRRADALGRLAEAALTASLDSGSAGDRYQVVLHVDADNKTAVATIRVASLKPTQVRSAFPRKRFGASAAMRQSSRCPTTLLATRWMSGAEPARFRRPFGEPSKPETRTAAFPAAPRADATHTT